MSSWITEGELRMIFRCRPIKMHRYLVEWLGYHLLCRSLDSVPSAGLAGHAERHAVKGYCRWRLPRVLAWSCCSCYRGTGNT